MRCLRWNSKLSEVLLYTYKRWKECFSGFISRTRSDFIRLSVLRAVKIGWELSCTLQSVVTVTWESSRCPGSGVIGHLMPTSREGEFKTGSEFWFYFGSSLVRLILSLLYRIETTASRSMNLRFNTWNLFQYLHKKKCIYASLYKIRNIDLELWIIFNHFQK